MVSPNEFYKFITTGEYPLDVPNIPVLPSIAKKSDELGKRAADIDSKK